MTVISQQLSDLILVLVAVAVFVAAIQFRKYRIMMAGESISPKWFGIIKWAGMIAGFVIFIIGCPGFGTWITQDVLGCTKGTDELLGTLLYVACILVIVFGVSALIKKIPMKWWDASAAKIFDEDKVCQYLLADAQNDAKEILIFRDRLEGRRGYSFDVDGYNHAQFSADGCRSLARYIMKRVPGAYTFEECNNAQGKGGAPVSSNSNGALVTNSNHFSHIKLTKKN